MMKVLHKNIWAIALLGIAFAKAQEITQGEEPWTLRSAVQYALDNNIQVKQSALGIDNAEVDEIQAWGAFIPSLNVSARLSSNTGANINPATNEFVNNTFTSFTPGFSSNLTLFDGLRNFRQIQRAKINQVLRKYQFEQSQNDVALLVSNNFLNILLARENLKTLQNQHEVTLQQIENTQEQVDAGTLPAGDILEIKATYATEEQQIVNARNDLMIAKISLAQVLNIDNYTNFEVAEYDLDVPDQSVLVTPVEEISDAATQNLPQAKAAKQNIELAEKDLSIAKGARWPVLSAFFGYNTRFADNDFLNRGLVEQLYENDGYSFGLSLNIPLSNNLNVYSNVERSKIAVEQQELAAEQTLLDLEANVYQAYTDAKGAYASLDAATKTVEAREQAFAYAQERYDVGLMNSFDYNQAQLQLTNARIDRNVAKFNFIFNLKVLEIYFGILPKDLRLK